MKKLILLLAAVGMLLEMPSEIWAAQYPETIDYSLTPGTYSSWADVSPNYAVYNINSSGEYHFSGTIPHYATFVINADNVTIYLENFSMPYGGLIGSIQDSFKIYGSSVELILVGENTIASTWGYPVNVKSTGSLTISSENDGLLNLNTSSYPALQSDGTTTIEGGTVIANETGPYTGISGSGDLVVNDGTLIATGGSQASGISIGSVTVNGGAVVAEGHGSAAGIDSDNIVVGEGTVSATSESGVSFSSDPANTSGETLYCVTLPGATAGTSSLFGLFSVSGGTNTYTYTVTEPANYNYSYSGSGFENTDDLYFYLPDGTYVITGSDAAQGRQYGGTVSGAAVTFEVISGESSLSGEAWSSAGRFDGSEITSESFLLLPTDSLPYDSALSSGTPISLTIGAVDQADETKIATIFSDTTGTAVEGSTTWNYTATDLPKNDTYTLTETVVSSYETKALSRSVTILPEPAIFALLVIAGALFLRKRVKSLLAISVIAALSSLGVRADVVSDVKFRQMRPFSRDVVISYTIVPADNTIYDVKFYGSTDNGTTVFDLQDKGTLHLSTLNEAFCDAGVHKAVWTPDESFYGEVTENFKVKVEATAIPSENNYLVIDLSGGASAASYPVSYLADVPAGGWTEEYKTTKMVMRLIPAGTFIMGSPTDELGRGTNETQHQVTLTKPYYVGVFETTQKQYELVMGSNPSQYIGDARPVEQVSYNMLRGASAGAGWPNSSDVDEDSFFGKLRAKTNMSFDLPTEAQWEFACRAETTTALNSGKNLTSDSTCKNMAEVGRYYRNQTDGKGGYSDHHTTVGSYRPNAWGLYDTHGNVMEWCLDGYADYDGDAVDPKGPNSGETRVVRSGGWDWYAGQCRAAFRISTVSPDRAVSGFRVVLVQ